MLGIILNEPSNCELFVFIQCNSQLELLKLPNILLHLDILLPKKGDFEVDFLAV